MKAKTKRRLIHILTKKKLVKKKHSKLILRNFLIGLATISMGSLAYAIALNKPTVGVAVHSSGAAGVELQASPAPTPRTAGGGAAQAGRASWYAFGLPAPDALTCASRTFPRGTFLQVKDLDNDRTMVCLVNDYGPAAWTGRAIDLSRGSFSQIDNLGRGTIPVEIRVASGPSGFNLPVESDVFSAVVGYNLCQNSHTAQYCDDHRQD
ncbi:MAG TPA: septal ring lytic transglycosylase RlpA family protein [Candidatus Saccharimonadia bacterium]|jgi:rare lipoprotein A (peptidoglycan hydrolase)